MPDYIRRYIDRSKPTQTMNVLMDACHGNVGLSNSTKSSNVSLVIMTGWVTLAGPDRWAYMHVRKVKKILARSYFCST
jgi:hypothetical protein